jgi:hypothetical protein
MAIAGLTSASILATKIAKKKKTVAKEKSISHNLKVPPSGEKDYEPEIFARQHPFDAG